MYIGDGYVFEAKPGGAGAKAFAAYKDTEYKIFRLRISDAERHKFVCAVVQQNGEGYDYGQILSIAVQRLFGFDMKADNGRLAICSELIYRAAQAANIPVPSIPERLAIPGDFLNWPIAFQIQE